MKSGDRGRNKMSVIYTWTFFVSKDIKDILDMDLDTSYVLASVKILMQFACSLKCFYICMDAS